MITFGELCAGVGTSRLAMEELDCRCSWSCEIDKFARETYKANFGEYPEYEDLTKLSNPPCVDVIISGFPCPSFSIAGKRKGFEDERGELFFDVARIINEVQPKAFILENVKGIKSHDSGKTFKIIIKTLKDCGYKVYQKTLNSKNYGVPQNRERVYFVGFRNDIYNPLTDGIFIYPKKQKLDKTIADVLEPDVDEKYYLSDKMVKCLTEHLERHKEKGDGFGMNILDIDTNVCNSLGAGGMSKERNLIVDSYNKAYNKNQDISKAVRTNDGCSTAGQLVENTISQRYHKDGSENLILQRKSPVMGAGGHNVPMVRAVLTPDRKNKCQHGRRFKETGESMFTLTGQDIHGVTIDKRLRKLTPLECFRLQGFPDNFVKKTIGFKISDTQLYRQSGNAFTLSVIKAVGTKVVEKLGGLKE